jgi:uncharacterized protein (DUF1800 family)
MDNLNPRTPFRATNHLGLGANARDLLHARSPAAWVKDQIGASTTVAGMPATRDQIALYQDSLRARQEARSASIAPDKRALKLRMAQKSYRQESRDAVTRTLLLRLQQSTMTEAPVKERLALFWSNHFTVSRLDRPQIAGACAAYENEAIRANLDGHFAELLVSVVQHPVMLLFLDNAVSTGPNSVLGKRRSRSGINENLAREILELHTLGVDGGYGQEDVMALARIITGWTVGNTRSRRYGIEPGDFGFLDLIHEPGTQRLLGRDYADQGLDQGVSALRDLAAHPSTARFIARKLVTQLAGDTPSDADIDQVAAVFQQTDGHLPSVHAAALNLESVWEPAVRKFKTPYELLVSALRGLDVVRPPGAEGLLHALATMNHSPFFAPSPAGWPDTAGHWSSPTALDQRISWGVSIAEYLGNHFDAPKAAVNMLDPSSSARLLTAIDEAASPTQGLALLLASPDFQWR